MIKNVKAYKSGRSNTTNFLVRTESKAGRIRYYRYTIDEAPKTVLDFIATHNFKTQGSGHLFE